MSEAATTAAGPSRAHLFQTLVGAGVFVIGASMAWGARTIASAIGYSGVGPNFLPWVIAAALMICGGFLIYEARTREGFSNFPEPSGAAHGAWGCFAWVSAGLLLNAALITTIGFILSCTLCYMLAVRGLRRSQGRDDWRPRTLALDALTGFAIAAPVYWMFTQALAINLPGLTETGWL